MPQTHQQDRKRESNVPKATDDIQKSAKKDLAGQDFASQEAALVPPVQMREAPGRGGQDVQAAAQHGVKGGGQALPHIEQIQASFGDFDVSQIQAHVGGQASEASDAMGAEAYATGNDVVFRDSPDLHLVAHEAAHVVQQRSGASPADGVGRPGDPYEQHADEVADAVVRGESAEELLDEQAGRGGGGGSPVQRRAIQFEMDPAVPSAVLGAGHAEVRPIPLRIGSVHVKGNCSPRRSFAQTTACRCARTRSSIETAIFES